jgi:Kef-type K+ transport system membrane component KefB
MIVALIGLNQGLIKQDIYVSIILMSLVTTIVTPIILRNWLYREGGKQTRTGRPVARRAALR